MVLSLSAFNVLSVTSRFLLPSPLSEEEVMSATTRASPQGELRAIDGVDCGGGGAGKYSLMTLLVSNHDFCDQGSEIITLD